ncbi:hypothetical protein RHGRI_022447 [Rhododendron griersonianum]|uniref:Uncharacterized protein n=1 Tax=Rhododendron griersonianum TaxID=479676 RepID=A0AAV6J191_9ERIC|nr:hypothetical protein RHGRI_022447 [Rhododendron griersonianum]
MFESRKPVNTMASDGKLHIVLFPWLAFGHMIPFLELAKRIAKRGHKISFLSTPRNIERLPKLPLNLAPTIALVKLPLPAVDGLPENAEATSDVPTEKVHFLKKAFDGLEPGLTQFLQTSNPDWIIYDFAPYWLPPIAAKLGISRGFFNAVNAWFLAFLGPSTNMIDGSDPRTKLEDYIVPPKWVPSDSNLAHRYYEIKWIVESAQNITADVLDTYRLGSAIIGCEVLATRDCEEFEPDWLKILQELNKRTVLPVGLMPPSVQDSLDTNDPWVSIKGWLDGQTKGSVVYVGLGSELALNQETLTELALGRHPQANSKLAMAGDGKKLHVAMFPWLAFGHMIPFLDLAKFIAQKGHKISYLSTPRNLTRLPKLPPHLTSLITFVPISLPRVDELPENAEATMDVHPDDVHYLKKAFDGLDTELARSLETESPDWIIYDFAPHWLPPIAGKLGISRAFFSIINAWFLAFFGPSAAMLDNSVLRPTDPEQFLVPPKWITFPTKAAYRAYEIKRTFKTGSEPQNASGVEDFYRVGCIITGCDALAIRHCREFEPNWLTLLEELHGKPIIPLGLMPPLVEESSSDDSKNDTWVSISEWLNKQTIGLMEEHKVGIEVPRDEADGSFTRNSVAESIALVMVDKEKGSIYRERSKEMSSLFADKLLHDQYLDNFVQYLENHRC